MSLFPINRTESEDNGENLALPVVANSSLNAIPAALGLLDQRGILFFVNERWRHFNNPDGLHGSTTVEGTNYFELCENASEDLSEFAPRIAQGIRSVLGGSAVEFALECSCRS